MDNSVPADDDNANMNTVASGVRVTLACVDAINAIIAMGDTDSGKYESSNISTECAMGAAEKNSGKMIPPGNLPAHARAIARSLTHPT